MALAFSFFSKDVQSLQIVSFSLQRMVEDVEGLCYNRTEYKKMLLRIIFPFQECFACFVGQNK